MRGSARTASPQEGPFSSALSGVVYVRRPEMAYQGDGLGEWRGTNGGILMNWQVQQDAVCRLVPEAIPLPQGRYDQDQINDIEADR